MTAADADPAAVLRERLAAAAEHAGLFLDFDGTLAPIVDDPAAAAMPAELAPVLTEVAARLRLLAVVSGRPAAFLAERVGAHRGLRLLGLYGLQEWVDGAGRARPEAADWQPAIDAAKERVAVALAAADGVVIEDKGLSVAVHWRNAPDREQAGRSVALLTEGLAAETGLACEPGKFVQELRPPVEWDKGASVRALTRELGLREVVYIGDDLGDLAAFAAAQELGGAAIAVETDETPARLRAAADAVLPGTDAVAGWLTRLRAALGG